MQLRPYSRGIAGALLFGVVAAVTAAEPATRADPAMPAENAWRFLTFEQRHAEMTFLVHPALMERYQAFYETPAPTLRCVTCHGEDAEVNRYRMAYTPLDELRPSAVRALYVEGAEVSAEQAFKRDVVTPLMARLLGVPRYDPATGLGFSCFGCHPREAE